MRHAAHDRRLRRAHRGARHARGGRDAELESRPLHLAMGWSDGEPWTGRVVELDLLRHGLSGQIPASLVRLTGLEVLRLYGNELTGGIPPELGLLTNLRELDLGANPLGGEIPPELGSLTALVELNLYTMALVGEIPEELGSLELLERLNTYGNNLEGLHSRRPAAFRLHHPRTQQPRPATLRRAIVGAVGRVDVEHRQRPGDGPAFAH